MEGTKKILENSINPYNTTAEEIQELAVKLTEETFGKRDVTDIGILEVSSMYGIEKLIKEIK
ncbi:hypothetical protein [uncultured Clostridium sp.]|uniref:hypothetical protein n=1 Tax=uncultured Clostridium sp. TaxID=59620 RepID=UPI00321634D3